MVQAFGTHEADVASVSAILQGNRRELDRLTDHYLPYVHQHVQRFTTDPIAVESLCERAFLRLLDSLSSFGASDRLDAWVFSAVRAALAEACDDGLI